MPTSPPAKFRELDRVIQDARRTKVDAIMVAKPEVLGDTYEELCTNLNKLADAKLGLIIRPRAERG